MPFCICPACGDTEQEVPTPAGPDEDWAAIHVCDQCEVTCSIQWDADFDDDWQASATLTCDGEDEG